MAQKGSIDLIEKLLEPLLIGGMTTRKSLSAVKRCFGFIYHHHSNYA